MTATSEERRFKAIQEFISTEATYVQKLLVLRDEVITAFRQFVEPRIMRDIFSNVYELIPCNTHFLADLERRAAVLNPSTGYIDRIGDILIRHLQQLQPYTIYCGHQRAAQLAFSSLLERNPRISHVAQDIFSSSARLRQLGVLNLTSLLLEPMQRVTRYTLLTRAILKYTPEAHPDHADVSLAASIADNLCSLTNDIARQSTDEMALKKWQQCVFPGLPWSSFWTLGLPFPFPLRPLPLFWRSPSPGPLCSARACMHHWKAPCF